MTSHVGADTHPVAIDAVDLVVRAVGEVGGVQLVLALHAQEALLVVGAALRDLLLRLKDASVAPVR
jgi:hypothetical protein